MTIIPITIEGVSTRKDNTVAIRLSTQELPPAKMAELMALNNKFAFCAIKPEKFSHADESVLKELKADYQDSGKSPGQRLRGVLYKNYEQDKEGFTSFTLYYDHHMERIINHFKSKLT